MREIKFRAWHKEQKRMLDKVNISYVGSGMIFSWYDSALDWELGELTDCSDLDAELMQYTGLKDKNGEGCYEVYEGDIITMEGKIRGNIYEDEPRSFDIVIPPIGTKAWITAYKEAMDRGFDYSE